MPFVQRVVEPKFLSRTSLWDEEGKPLVDDDELEAVTNNTLSNALRQLASLVLVADDIFAELGNQLKEINKRAEGLKVKIEAVEGKVADFDPKKVTVPESDICTFAIRKQHYAAKHNPETNLFTASTRPQALQCLYESATKTPVHVMRQLDRWRRDGHRSSRFFLCTPVLGNKRRKIRSRVDIDIETRMPAAVKDLRRWTSSEALGDITVTPDCPNRIAPNVTLTDGEVTDGTAISDDEGIDHKLPSPEEQLHVVALKFPAEIVAVDVSGRSFDRMSVHRRSLLQADGGKEENLKRRRTRRPRSRRRNTLAGTDQKEIRDALTGGEEPCSSGNNDETESTIGAVSRSKSSDLLRPKKDSPDKKSHFNTLKQWGKNRYDRFMNKSAEKKEDIDDFNLYETVTMKRKRNPSISSSEKSVNLPVSSPLSSVMNMVKLRQSSARRANKDEPPHSSSGNWSASSESGRASIGSEFTTTTQPKSSATSNNSLNQPGRRRFVNTSTSSSITSEGTLTPDIIHDLHEDGDSVYSCDTEGYYTSFHMDSGLKTLKEEELPATPLHSTSAFANPGGLTAENEYELFGKGSTSTTTSSAGTVCTTLRAESSKSLNGSPVVPERKSSLKRSDDDSDKTGTVKRSPANKPVHGDVSPDSGHNTSSSPIESTCSPTGVRSGSEFEFSESSDMEGTERTERIRIKTTINSSRIPSMCVITPPHSDEEDAVHVKERIITVASGKMQINVNPQSGYATVEVVDVNKNTKVLRAPSPSGGTLTVNELKTSPAQPIIKATLMPLNNMLGRIKTNLVNLTRRESKSVGEGDYVTLADVRNNNEKRPRELEVKKPTEYVSLNDLPSVVENSDSLERKRRGARVTLDAEGKVVFSSDSLRRRKVGNSTFEPGPFVKASCSPTQSPVPSHRLAKSVRALNRPLSPPLGKVVIRAVPGMASPTSEIVRMPPTTIVAPSVRPSLARGAYVHVQAPGSPLSPAQDTDRVPASNPGASQDFPEQYYFQKGNTMYQTLPSKRSQFFHYDNPERSVTPDITRGLERSSIHHLGIPVQIPDVRLAQKVPFQDSYFAHISPHHEAMKISPIDPRNSGSFHASTPSAKTAVNLESRLMSPKKSTMSNEELYAVIHKSKKKMNIYTEETRGGGGVSTPPPVRSPETGYIGDKSRSRLSWSPSKGEYVDFNTDIDKLSPPNESRSRQSWACSDRKGTSQTSRLDFKKLLLQKSNVLASTKKLSAVEQLKLSKEQLQKPMTPPPLNILELSGSPRSLVNRKFGATAEKPKAAPKIMSPRSQWRFANPRSDVLSSTILEDCREDESPSNSMEKKKVAGGDTQTLAQRLQAQRAQFFTSGKSQECSLPPTLETAF